MLPRRQVIQHKEGSEAYEKIVRLKFKASDGKYYTSDAFATEDVL